MYIALDTDIESNENSSTKICPVYFGTLVVFAI